MDDLLREEDVGEAKDVVLSRYRDIFEIRRTCFPGPVASLYETTLARGPSRRVQIKG